VLGHFVTGEVRAAALPGAALVQAGGRPALWVVDPATGAVALQPVTLLRYEAGRVLVTDGVAEGALVVVAGVQSLRPGEKVQPIQAPAP
jgi:multidrug efflux pump subunit AcrA (membrane-fusion protein)